MKYTHITTKKRVGFSGKALYIRKEKKHQSLAYMRQKSSFFVAALSLVAFIAGNMVGDHGWYAFWKSVLGEYDDSLITYTGTVLPISQVPDYDRWSEYGGNAEAHTYRQIPKDILIPLPIYDAGRQKSGELDQFFSVGHMGSYKTGHEGEGSHPGVDIRVPVGTPVRSIANGIVTDVREDPAGFGKLIVIRHPHMPDPDAPDYETVLHSIYAHLSTQYVLEGDIIQKGQEIGLSGMSGYATGPHLHFQLDRDTAPWHPYWPFSYGEARGAGYTTAQAINAAFHQDRGYEYTVHPMDYVQENYSPAKYQEGPSRRTVVQNGNQSSRVSRTLAEAREERRSRRLSLLARKEPSFTLPKDALALATNVPMTVAQVQASSAASSSVSSSPVSTEAVARIEVHHDGRFQDREWEKVTVVLLDENGKKVDGGMLQRDIHFRTDFGEAEFNPKVLTPLDFKNGEAVVEVLPRGRRTVVILLEPYKVLSEPLVLDAD